MASSTDSSSNPEEQDHYSLLGLEPGASFEDVQKARDRLLSELSDDDPLPKARIEASYDALLMVSLKQRQLGKVSTEAVSASKREEKIVNAQFGNNIGSKLLNNIKGFNSESSKGDSSRFLPELSFPDGQGLNIRLALALLALVLLLVSSEGSVELILSLSTIGLFISQIRRGRKPLPSLGWSVTLLSIGLVLGGLMLAGINGQSHIITNFSKDQLEALPAIILIWSGVIFL